MSEWLPRNGNLLTKDQRIIAVRDEEVWEQLTGTLWGKVRDAACQEAGDPNLTTADLATLLVLASRHKERPDKPTALPTFAAPLVEAYMSESAARMTYAGPPAPLLGEAHPAFDFVCGDLVDVTGYVPTGLGLMVVDSLIQPA